MIKIIFSNPVYLWYLISIPLLIVSHFFFLRTAKYKALQFANFHTIKRITGSDPGKKLTRNWLVLFLRLIVLLFIILSISGPVIWFNAESHNQDFVLAMDTSASMLAQDFQPTRLEFAKVHAFSFVESITGNSKIGLIDFSGSTFVDQILTDDKNKLKEAIEQLEVVPIGGTDISGAIITASNMLINSNEGRVMVLISDGSNTVDAYNNRAMNIALNYAVDNNIIINTVGIGTNSGPIGYLAEYYNISAIYDSKQLISIANFTEGQFYDGSSSTAFSEAMKNMVADTKQVYLSKDATGILMLLALLALLIEWWLSNTRYRRLL